MTRKYPAKIEEFIGELTAFAKTAEETLTQIEADLEGKKDLFSVFQERMLTIRGTAQQLGFPEIANLAGLGEEIAVKAPNAPGRPQIRKAIGALWDALTTIKYLIEHYDEETGDEQQILVNRLEATLKALGGSRDKVSEREIEQLLRQKRD